MSPHPIESRPLRCPYCGGRISVELSWRGTGYLSEQVPDGYSCDETACGAAWDRDGNPEAGPYGTYLTPEVAP